MSTNGGKKSLLDTGPRDVFVFIQRPVKPVFLTDSFLDLENTPEKFKTMNEKGWTFSLNFVRERAGSGGAFSLYLQDIEQNEKPIVIIEVPTTKNGMVALLSLPRQMFGSYETNALILDGKYSHQEVKQITEQWILSLPKMVN